ncbi:MAG TPA: methyltransferase domain-containing protein [Verrucomicrobiae bacterium]|nr:methyltransferase domain-containing protein [Verrucomicrobiae bacterium]
MSKTFIFDTPEALRFVKARQDFIQGFLPNLKVHLGLESALDVGCGLGDFSQFLRDSGFQVSALDGRKENVEEAQRRVENVNFRHADVEDASLATLGSFDLVLCVGLLYHLENPFRAIRNLFALTGKVLIVESRCIPDESTTLYLVDEGMLEDQGLNYVAFYPSEGCLIKMFYRAGFPFVYRFRSFPDHEQFRQTDTRKRSRTMLVASQVELEDPALVLAVEPGNAYDPWLLKWPGLKQRAMNFLRRPWNERFQALRRRLGASA